MRSQSSSGEPICLIPNRATPWFSPQDRCLQLWKQPSFQSLPQAPIDESLFNDSLLEIIYIYFKMLKVTAKLVDPGWLYNRTFVPRLRLNNPLGDITVVSLRCPTNADIDVKQSCVFLVTYIAPVNMTTSPVNPDPLEVATPAVQAPPVKNILISGGQRICFYISGEG